MAVLLALLAWSDEFHESSWQYYWLYLLGQMSLIRLINPHPVCMHFSPLSSFYVLLGMCVGEIHFQLGPTAMKMSCLTNWGIRLYPSLPENQGSSYNTNHPFLCGTGWEESSKLRLQGVLTEKLFEQIRLLLYVTSKYGFWLNHMDFASWETEAYTVDAPGRNIGRVRTFLLQELLFVQFSIGSYRNYLGFLVSCTFYDWPETCLNKRLQMRRPLSFVEF